MSLYHPTDIARTLRAVYLATEGALAVAEPDAYTERYRAAVLATLVAVGAAHGLRTVKGSAQLGRPQGLLWEECLID